MSNWDFFSGGEAEQAQEWTESFAAELGRKALPDIPAQERQDAGSIEDLLGSPKGKALKKLMDQDWKDHFVGQWKEVGEKDFKTYWGSSEAKVRKGWVAALDDELKQKGLIGRKVKASNTQRNRENTMSSLRNRVIRLAHSNPEIRGPLLQVLKQAHGPVALKAPDVMLYMIVKGENKSKFYEMGVFPASRAPRAKKDKGDTNGDWVLSKHWGRLTDSGGTGRVDSMNEYFYDERSAEAAMSKHTATKTRKGYQDISRDREYPIGLGSAGFGWGGQAVCSIQPELIRLSKAVDTALEELDDGLSMVGPLAATDSTMAKKLTGLLHHALKDCREIASYLDQQLAECR